MPDTAERRRQKTPFTSKKEISAGEIQKNKAKGFSGGASGRMRPQALGLSLHGSAISLKMGSSLVVKIHQNWTNPEIVARMGDFFLRFAQQNPNVFREGRNFWGSRRLRFFVF